MIEGVFPAGRVDPVGVAPAEVVALAERCELLEAVAEAAEALRAGAVGTGVGVTVRRDLYIALGAALVAAGATGKAGT